MQSFNVEENLDLIIKPMSAMGVWPKTKPSTLYILRGSITMSFLIFLGVLIVTDILKFVDVKTTCLTFCFLLPVPNILVKYYCICIKKENFYNLMKMLNDPLLSLHEDRLYIFLKEKAQLVRLFQYGYYMSGVICVITYKSGI